MNVLYYLELTEELKNPLFRLGTIRNHIEHESTALKGQGVNVRVMGSSSVISAAKSEGLLSDISCCSVSARKLKKIYSKENVLLNRYLGKVDRSKEKSVSKLCKSSLQGFIPDVIIVYEGVAEFFREVFPKALVLNSTLGILSRAPYPEMGCLDPCGVFENSFLNKYKEEIRSYPLDSKSRSGVLRLKKELQTSLLDSGLVNYDYFKQFKGKVMLLPLQVSNYFAFDGCVKDEKFTDQLDYVEHVMERISSNVYVYVTFHGVDDEYVTSERFSDLMKRYPNLLYSHEIQKIRWCSQYVLPACDGVIAVSSSLGLQALIWDKPVYTLGNSHLDILSSGSIDCAGREVDLSKYLNILGFMLDKYYPAMDVTTRNPEWYAKFLQRSLSKFRSNGIDFNFFDEIYANSPYKAIGSAIRSSTMHEEISRFSPNTKVKFGIDVEEMKSKIAKSKIVSFDVFDTLVTRNVFVPNSVFDLMQNRAESIFSASGQSLSDHGDFRELRERAANRVIRHAKSKELEEITLDDVYVELKRLAKLTDHAAEKLKALEVECELQALRPRKIGRELFDYACNLGKKVIIVSDMYLDKSHIEKILSKNGFTNYHAMYVSSDYKKTKKTGSLFDVVKQAEKCNTIVHIGDNYLADIVKASEKGMEVIHLPLISDIYKESNSVRDCQAENTLSSSIGSSIVNGIISRKFYDLSYPQDSWFAGRPYRLGYEACSTILFSFVKWLIEKSKEDGVDELLFLARDGYLVKEIYDLVSRKIPGAPKSHYILASRRCYNTASLMTKRDIFNTMSLAFSPIELHKIFEYRYGILKADLDEKVAKKCGFDGLDHVVDIKRGSHKRKFRAFLEANSGKILDNSQKEREALKKYLEPVAKTDFKRAVVDIGHNATLQRDLAKIMGWEQDLSGYYFMTFHGAKKVHESGLSVAGFLSDFEDSKLSSHPYCKNIGMFEFLFLPAIPSFKKFVIKNDIPEPVFVDGDESVRFDKISEVHRGVIDFVKDYLRVAGGDLSFYDLSKNESIRKYTEFTQLPYPRDVRMFRGVSFVDQFGGSNARYLVEDKAFSNVDDSEYDNIVRASWWREGCQAVICGYQGEHNQHLSPTSNVSKGAIKISSYKRKFRKFKRNPRGFFLDSKIYKIVAGR